MCKDHNYAFLNMSYLFSTYFVLSVKTLLSVVSGRLFNVEQHKGAIDTSLSELDLVPSTIHTTFLHLFQCISYQQYGHLFSLSLLSIQRKSENKKIALRTQLELGMIVFEHLRQGPAQVFKFEKTIQKEAYKLC